MITVYKISPRTLYIRITDEAGHTGWGEVSPLPNWSRETLDDCLVQLENLNDSSFLHPSVSFGLESALFSLITTPSPHTIPCATLLQGPNILEEAHLKYNQGYRVAKLKVSSLSFSEATALINQLKDLFTLRIDVNRAWATEEALKFFSQFHQDTFDYVEEPFQNPHDLPLFTHPLALDESLRDTFTLDKLSSLPTLKALVYKPTLSGGLSYCLPYHKWCQAHNKQLVLSSCFETPLGLSQITTMAHHLNLTTPVGLGQ